MEKHKSIFSLSIENNKKGHELSIALGMVGIDVTPRTAKLILETQKVMRKMGGQFDLKTACNMKLKHDEELRLLQDTYNNQKNI